VTTRRHVSLDGGGVLAYGYWGRPVLAFPSQQGECWQYEERGMIDAVAGLLDAGRAKLYCVDSFDGASWSNASIPLEERARAHERYEAWILEQVVPWIHADCGGPQEIATFGVSLGAYHAVNVALRHADVFPLALGFSGNYDPSSWHAWGERGDAAYFNNPMESVANAGGDHLDWLRGRLSVLLVCGQGMWEDTTGSLHSTRALAELLQRQGIRCELDLWGHDVPHDWPSWRAQLAHHLPRFC
jgi:esterase/lipase superfamily enzyme